MKKKKRSLKNTGKLRKILEVRKICQSEKVVTTNLIVQPKADVHSDTSMISKVGRVPTAPGKPGKMVTVFPAWKNPGILSFLPNILEK